MRTFTLTKYLVRRTQVQVHLLLPIFARAVISMRDLQQQMSLSPQPCAAIHYYWQGNGRNLVNMNMDNPQLNEVRVGKPPTQSRWKRLAINHLAEAESFLLLSARYFWRS